MATFQWTITSDFLEIRKLFLNSNSYWYSDILKNSNNKRD